MIFDLPEFNGTVRVMAMAWTADAVGHAVKDVIVRDPVVVSASLPRFLATGDTSRILVEINNVAGAAGDYRLAVNADAGLTLDAADMTRTLALAEKERKSINIPIDRRGGRRSYGFGDALRAERRRLPAGADARRQAGRGCR